MDIREILKIHGKENVYVTLPLRPLHNSFLFSYTTSSDEPVNVECKFVEKRYKLSDNYKIEFEPLEKGFPIKTFYLSDFNSLLNDERVKLSINIEDNV